MRVAKALPLLHPPPARARARPGITRNITGTILRRLFRERVQSFSPSRSRRLDSIRLGDAMRCGAARRGEARRDEAPGRARRGVEPKKVYRKMAARIYVIRGRRLFPGFLHLLYTAASATRW